jgi:AraC-like DNA-binding protein
LQEQGTSYSVLLEAARRRDACRMLAGRELLIKEIGAVLGYDDPANFTRAFRAWTGMSPRAWREQHAAEAAASAGRAGRS